MPLYDYECTNKRCGKNNKVMQFIVPLKQFEEVVKCPLCRKPLVRMLSAPYFTIK